MAEISGLLLSIPAGVRKPRFRSASWKAFSLISEQMTRQTESLSKYAITVR
jgi:hypothetical protein